MRKLRLEIIGIKIKTIQGFSAWWSSRVFGNLAVDGDATGEVLLNRYSLPRSETSVANSIVHEVAHKAGLKHPSITTYNPNWPVGVCEPPYVIGSLIEKNLLNAKWQPTNEDCEFLHSK